MKSKDIIMQVSKETADVMDDISEQLMEESDARFDEVVEAIEEAVRKVESLYTEFTGFASNSNSQLTSNQGELMNKFASVLDTIEEFRKEVGEQTVQSNIKVDRLIEIMVDVPQLIQAVSRSISDATDARSEAEATLLQAVEGLAHSLTELQKVQSDVMDKLNSDDSHEILVSTLNNLSDIEKEILQTKEAIGDVSNTICDCKALVDRLLSSVKGLQENDKKILTVGIENEKKVDELGKQTDENSKLLIDKMDDILACLDALSHSIQTISEKQTELDKDVKYLKLPFFKRWFTKG